MRPEASKISALEREPNAIAVDWKDGHRSRFHNIWLRHQCECDSCGTTVDGIRDVWLADLPDNPGIAELSWDEDGLDVTWEMGRHRSHYTGSWLRRHCYSTGACEARRHRPRLWDAQSVDPMPEFDLKGIAGDGVAKLEMLEAVRDWGFCKFVNMDTSIDGIREAAELFGPVRMTHYGISDIHERSAQYNVGDSGRPLLPHTDENYRISSLGITLFQVVQPSERGGHSTLVDGFEVARRVRERFPEAFDLLASVPLTFRRHHTGESLDGKHRLMMSRFPAIKLDEAGRVGGVRINERQVSLLSIDEALVEPMYRALRLLFEVTYDPGLRIELPLRSGEGMAFDNQRVLHGRTEFIRGRLPRHVRTCTVDTEEFHSTLRLLEMRLEKPGADLIMHQGM